MTLLNKNNEITQDMFEPAVMDSNESEVIAGKSTSFLKDSFQRLVRNKAAVISAIILLVIVALALIGPMMNKYGIDDQNVTRQNLSAKIPGLDKIHWLPFDGFENNVNLYKTQHAKADFWFGTDDLGRDLWTRTWKGTQISLFIAVVAAAVDLIIGVAYGGISAYFGGKVDNILQRIVEVILGIPNLVIIILMILILRPGLISIIVAIALTGWVNMSRIVRAQMLRLKSEEYVLASRTLGASHTRIISRHLLPNTLGQIIINTMFTIPSAIFFEAFLSFIGLGIKDPVASLGSLINRGFGVLQIHPYQVVFPGIVISLLLICFNILGDGLRDAFDPKLRQ